MMNTGTIRQQITELLSSEPLGAREISQELHISEKEVYDHLVSIRKSVAASGKKLSITPAACLSCGFVFRDRKRYKPPGSCPKCRKTHIQRPLFSIG